MKHNSSRRRFLQAGLALPAVGLLPGRSLGSLLPQPSPSGLAYRTLGKTGLKVTSVGCAAGTFPDPEVLARAVDLGINYYDTARFYGEKSELMLGRAIKGKRDKIILASKTFSNTKETILKDLETSLKMLGTDYIDVYHQHSRHTPKEINDEMIETMELVKQQGKVRFIGVSTHDPNAMVDFILKVGKFDVVQTTYSFAIGAPFRDAAIKRMYDAGIGIVAMKVIIATATPGPIPKENTLTNEAGLAALKWVLRNPAISTMIPFHEEISEVEINFRAMTEEFTPQDEKILFVRNEQIRELYCRMCFECKGKCPKGVPVADELRILAYNDFAGDFRRARDNFWELPRAIRSIRCSDCSECVVQCPNGVKVHDRLIRAQELLA